MHDPVFEQIKPVEFAEEPEPLAHHGLRIREMRRAVIDRIAVAIDEETARNEHAMDFRKDLRAVILREIVNGVVRRDHVDARRRQRLQGFQRIGLTKVHAAARHVIREALARLIDHLRGAVDGDQREIVARGEKRQRADPRAAADFDALQRGARLPFRDRLADALGEHGVIGAHDAQKFILRPDLAGEQIVFQNFLMARGHGFP